MDNRNWINTRMRKLLAEDKPIGPRYPSGQFQIYNPRDTGILADPIKEKNNGAR